MRATPETEFKQDKQAAMERACAEYQIAADRILAGLEPEPEPAMREHIERDRQARDPNWIKP